MRQKDVFRLDFGPAGAYQRYVGDVTLDRRVDGQLVETVRADALWELVYFGTRTRAAAPEPSSSQPSAPILVHRA